MKSMLQEASSVAIAIEKAWNNSGNPEEFTIKILEFGDKSFWGKTKQPAIVSITYDPKRQPKKNMGKKNPQKTKIKTDLVKKEVKKKGHPGLLSYLFGKSEEKSEKAISNERERVHFDKKANRKKAPSHGWTQDLADQSVAWLKGILQIMGIKTRVSIKIENRILNVFLDGEVLKEKEEEKLFFISISHLLMQFLKKKHKKRFQNFYLIIHSKILDANGDKKNTSSGR